MFWNDLISRGRPIVGLSPMDGVTDVVMRYMTAKYGNESSDHSPTITQGSELGGVDVMFTEFVSVDALHYAVGERRERLLKTFMRAREVGVMLRDQKTKEAKIYEVAQVFGNKPELFAEAAKLIEELGFDGIDINMGCPAHKVEENGSGAGLIRTPELARAIIRAVKGATKLPVSVKTRIGVESEVAEEWMREIMAESPAMISLHGRTLKQLYQGSADWEAIGRAATVVHELGGHILGNGDVANIEDGIAKVKEYGVDGFLIGRAAEGNPGVFVGDNEPSKEQRLAWIIEHTRIFAKIFEEFVPVRKHLAWYSRGFPGAAELRIKLVTSNSREEVERIIGELN